MTTYDWPITPVRVTSPFGPRWGTMHNGTDYGGDRGTNTPIRAIADGRITSRITGHQVAGNYLRIKHAGGVDSGYSHMSRFASNSLKPGVKVKRGQIIGYMGATGNVTGIHLHLAIWVNRKYVDPHAFLTRNINTPQEDEDMAITNEDLDNIGKAVWGRNNPTTDRTYAQLLRQAAGGVQQARSEIQAQNAIIDNMAKALSAVSGGEAFDQAKLLAGVKKSAEEGTKAALGDSLAFDVTINPKQ